MYGETFYGRHTAQHQLKFPKSEMAGTSYRDDNHDTCCCCVGILRPFDTF